VVVNGPIMAMGKAGAECPVRDSARAGGPGAG
jgi:hypothetical protein